MGYLRSSFKKLSASKLAPSILLFISAIAAAVIANSSAADVYTEFLSHEVHLRVGQFNLLSHNGENLTMLQFINDGLMTIFFLSVGLEIKRELLVGHLSSFRKAILPFIAACGGMIFPILIYAFIVSPDEVAMRGLAIPMATDIAFSLGVLSLLGKRVPVSLKIFLTAFAVVDDIGGILVIATCYSSHIQYAYLIWAGLLMVAFYFLAKYGNFSKTFFLVLGVVIWFLFLQSGIHSTISGVILAFLIPAKPRLDVGKYINRIRTLVNKFPNRGAGEIVLDNEQIERLKQMESASDKVISPIQSLEDNLYTFVNYIILPLFAFVNAGVVFEAGSEPIGIVTVGVSVGLLLGKFIGIFSFTWLSVKTRLVPLPEGMNNKNLAGVALLGGVGFTVSLFIGNLSFAENYPALLNEAKLGVLCGTIVSGILGYIVLRMVLPYPSCKRIAKDAVNGKNRYVENLKE